MKVYELEKGCTDLNGLKLVERPRPAAGARAVIARMRAASLNFRDLMVLSGRYFGGTVQRNTVPLSDGAGEVVEIGAEVTRFKVGDRIAGTFFRNWVDGPPIASEARPALGSPVDGVLAEYVAFDQHDAVLVPRNLSFEEAATLPCAGVTAWHALMAAGRPIQAGDSVLVQGTGGVSIHALQFARAAGARVLATSSSDAKLERARALGADTLINYQKTPNWAEEVLKMTGGRGVDCVVEVGGAGTLAMSMQAVACAGKIALIGVLTGVQAENLGPHAIMRKGANMHGIFVGNRAMFEQMNLAIEVNRIKPVVGRIFAFDEAAAAYEHLRAQAHFGKVVITI